MEEGEQGFNGRFGVAVQGEWCSTWILVSSVSSMLIFINVNASPAGLPSEKRVPTPITTSAACITS